MLKKDQMMTCCFAVIFVLALETAYAKSQNDNLPDVCAWHELHSTNTRQTIPEKERSISTSVSDMLIENGDQSFVYTLFKTIGFLLGWR